MKSKLGAIMMVAALIEGMNTPLGNNSFGRNIKDIDLSKKEPPIPKGCQEYFFNTLGDYTNHNDGLYDFKCIAINEKSAIKKFNKWKNLKNN